MTTEDPTLTKTNDGGLAATGRNRPLSAGYSAEMLSG